MLFPADRSRDPGGLNRGSPIDSWGYAKPSRKPLDFHRFFHRCGKLSWGPPAAEGSANLPQPPPSDNAPLGELTPFSPVRYDHVFLQGEHPPGRESHEAYVSTESPPPSSHPRISRADAHQERPHRAQAPSRQGPEAPDRQLAIVERTPLGAGWEVDVRARRPAAFARRVRCGSGRRPSRERTVSDAHRPAECARLRSARHHRVAAGRRRRRAQSRQAAAPRAVPARSAVARARGRTRPAGLRRHRASGPRRRAVCGTRGRFLRRASEAAPLGVREMTRKRPRRPGARPRVPAAAQSVCRRRVPLRAVVLGVRHRRDRDARPAARAVARASAASRAAIRSRGRGSIPCRPAPPRADRVPRLHGKTRFSRDLPVVRRARGLPGVLRAEAAAASADDRGTRRGRAGAPHRRRRPWKPRRRRRPPAPMPVPATPLDRGRSRHRRRNRLGARGVLHRRRDAQELEAEEVPRRHGRAAGARAGGRAGRRGRSRSATDDPAQSATLATAVYQPSADGLTLGAAPAR